MYILNRFKKYEYILVAYAESSYDYRIGFEYFRNVHRDLSVPRDLWAERTKCYIDITLKHIAVLVEGGKLGL